MFKVGKGLRLLIPVLTTLKRSRDNRPPDNYRPEHVAKLFKGLTQRLSDRLSELLVVSAWVLSLRLVCKA